MKNLSLTETLEIVLIRLRSGQTLRQSLSGLPDIESSRQIAKRWVNLRDQIFEGQTPALKSVEHFQQALVMEEHLKNELKSASQNPKMQSYIMIALCVCFLLYALCFFPIILRPGTGELSLCLGLIFIGIVWISLYLKKLKSQFWFIHWLELLNRLNCDLHCGQSLGPALNQKTQEAVFDHLPIPLKSYLLQCLDHIKRCEHLELETFIAKTPSFHSNIDVIESITQWNYLMQNYLQGHSLTECLDFFIESSHKRYLNRMKSLSQKLKFQLMLPLFFCFLPSFLVLLFGPILRQLMHLKT